MYRPACGRAGVVLAEETEEFFDAIETLVTVGARRPSAPSVAIVTVSGGPSVIAADCAERSGLAVPGLDDRVQRPKSPQDEREVKVYACLDHLRCDQSAGLARDQAQPHISQHRAPVSAAQQGRQV